MAGFSTIRPTPSDYMGEDPTCFFDPEDRTTISAHEELTNRLFKKYLLVERYTGFFTRPEGPRDH
jgi:hypothetical protein